MVKYSLGSAELVEGSIATVVAAASLTVNEMVVVRVSPPPVPVTVTETVPKVAVAEAVNVKVEVVVPGGVTESGVKE